MFDFLYDWLDVVKMYLFRRVHESLMPIAEGPKLTFSTLYDPLIPPEEGWSSEEEFVTL